METRLELTRFCYKPDRFSYVNDHDVKHVSIRTLGLTCENQERLYKKSQLLPRFHSKARSLSTQLWNRLFNDFFSQKVDISMATDFWQSCQCFTNFRLKRRLLVLCVTTLSDQVKVVLFIWCMLSQLLANFGSVYHKKAWRHPWVLQPRHFYNADLEGNIVACAECPLRFVVIAQEILSCTALIL